MARTSPIAAMTEYLQRLLTNAGTWLSRPWVVVAVLLYTKRSEHRDTQAIHAKLDELLRVHGDAQTQLTKLDEREPEQVEEFRDRARRRID